MFLPLILICIHWTGAAQMLSQALLVVLPEGIQVNQELRILGLVLILYSPLVRDVVQGLGQGCSWAEDESSEAGATFTMLFSLSPWQQPISPWSLDRNPICVRGLARERLVSLQGCSLRKYESSLNFTMLLRLESLFPFALSPPLAGGNIAILFGVILLDLDSCVLPVFQTLEVLDSWDLAVFFDSCGLPDSCRFPRSLGFLDLS